MAAGGSDNSPACPRCGYDLRGHVRGWEEGLVGHATQHEHGLKARATGDGVVGASCPVEGVCPECGLGFGWGELLDTRRQPPRWFFENRRRRATAVVLPTLVRLALAGRFYRRVSMSHRVAVGRLWGLVVAALAGAYVAPFAAAAVYELGQAAMWNASPRAGQWGPARYEVRMAWFPYGFDVRPTLLTIGNPLYAPLVVSVVSPLMLLALSDTRGMCRVRAEHVLRVGVYGLVPMLALAALSFAWSWVQPLVLDSFYGGGNWSRSGAEHVNLLLLLGVTSGAALWYLLYWWRALGRYMRLRPVVGVWLATAGVGLLAGGVVWFAVLVFASGGWGILL